MIDDIRHIARVRRIARKEALFGLPAIPAAAGVWMAGKATKTAGALLFLAGPLVAGFTGGMLHSKITSPSKKDFERMQDEAITADLRDRTRRLESLPARSTPKNIGNEGIWRP